MNILTTQDLIDKIEKQRLTIEALLSEKQVLISEIGRLETKVERLTKRVLELDVIQDAILPDEDDV